MKNTEGNGSGLGLFLYTAGILEETTKPLFQDGHAPCRDLLSSLREYNAGMLTSRSTVFSLKHNEYNLTSRDTTMNITTCEGLT